MRPRWLATACALTALAGCGGSAGGSTGPLTLQILGGAEEVRTHERIAAAYERRSGRKVRVVGVADLDGHIAKLTTGFAGGRAPDAFLVNYRNYAGFAAKGVLDPVGPRLDAPGGLEPGEFFAPPMKAFTFQDELQCLPQNVSSLVTYVNLDLFEREGVEPPDADWTIADLRRTSGQLARKLGKGRVHALGIDPRTVRAAGFVWAAGGELVDDPQRATRFTLDTPAARAGLQDLLDMVAYGPSEIEARAQPLEQRFQAGQLAMFMSSRIEVPAFRTIDDFAWDVAPFPEGKVRADVLHADAFCVSKGARADEAWRFVEFAAGPEGAAIAAKAGRTVPSLKSVAASPAFLAPDDAPRSSQVFLDTIPTVRQLPVLPDWPRIEDGADIAVEEAFYKQLGVDGILKRLKKETDGIL